MSAADVGDQSTAASKPPLEARIKSQKDHPLAWKTLVKRAVVVVISGIAIYLVFPAITEVLASWPRLSTLNPWWFAVAVGAEAAHQPGAGERGDSGGGGVRGLRRVRGGRPGL